MKIRKHKWTVALVALLVISIALNIRSIFVDADQYDEFVLYMADTMWEDTETLEELKRGNIRGVEERLSKRIGTKAMFLTMCIDNNCITREAQKRLKQKSILPPAD